MDPRIHGKDIICTFGRPRNPEKDIFCTLGNSRTHEKKFDKLSENS